MKELPVLQNGKPHVSYSEFSQWMRCSWRHYKKYIQNIDNEPPSLALIHGNTQHDFLEVYVKTLDLEEAKQAARNRIEGWRVENHQWLIDNPDIDRQCGVDFLVEQVAETGVRSIDFLNANFKNWELVETEETLYEPASTKSGQEYHFKGFVDLMITADKARGKGRETWILDWKTTSRPWTSDKLQDNKVIFQLMLYKKFISQKLSIPMNTIRCGYITIQKPPPPKDPNKVSKRKSTKPPKPPKDPVTFYKLYKVPATDRKIELATRTLNAFISMMETKKFLKNGHFQNECKYCPFESSKHCGYAYDEPGFSLAKKKPFRKKAKS